LGDKYFAYARKSKGHNYQPGSEALKKLGDSISQFVKMHIYKSFFLPSFRKIGVAKIKYFA
jgi:uncharacterized protein Yka (UPF0111/DUF47 family)